MQRPAHCIGQGKPVSVYVPIVRHPAFGDASSGLTLDKLLMRNRDLSRELLISMEKDEDYREIFDCTIGLEVGNEVDGT